MTDAQDSGTKPISPRNLTQHTPATYKLLVSFSMILILVIIALFAWNFYGRLQSKLPPNYVIHDNKAEFMRSLNQPNLTTNAILHWAMNAATTSLTFDFYNANDVLENVRTYFTPTGYSNFINAVNAAKLPQDIKKKKLIMYAVVTNNPVVLREGEITVGSGIYAWQIEFPMLLTFESEKAERLNVVVTLLISRVPTSESVSGIGISSFVMQRAERSSVQ